MPDGGRLVFEEPGQGIGVEPVAPVGHGRHLPRPSSSGGAGATARAVSQARRVRPLPRTLLAMPPEPTDTPDAESLARTSHQHHERIEAHVDRLPELAEMIGREPPAAFRVSFEAEYRFIVGQLVPHMEAIETTLYGRLERLMEGRHSMAPMRREHADLRRLIDALGEYRADLATGGLNPAEGMGLRRALYRLYAILKVHLAEEELYLGVLDHNLSVQEKDLLARGIEHAVAEPL